MLGKYIKINNEQMPNPNPGTFEYQYNPVENIFENEAGEQMANVKRLDRISWAATFQCTGAMKDRLLTICRAAECTCHINGVMYSGRLRLGGSVALYDNSEYIRGTDGLWTVPITFEGF